jgi:hypothetical protein
MARKELTVVIDAEGRDRGRTFFITEMPAAQGESWAIRVFLAMGRAGIDVPEDIAQAGLAGIARMGFKAIFGMSYEDAEPLLAEMMSCVQIIPDPKVPNVRRSLVDDDIEEVKTRLFLRLKVFELHTGFSMPAVAFPSPAPAAG